MISSITSLLNKLRLNQKLLVIAISVLSDFIITGVFSIIQLDRLSDLTNKMFRHPLTVSNAVLRVDKNIKAINNELLNSVINHSGNESENDIAQLTETIDADILLINERFLGDKQMLIKVEESLNKWIPSLQNLQLQLSKFASDSLIYVLLNGEYKRSFEELTIAINQLDDFAQNKAVSFKDNATSIKSNSKKNTNNYSSSICTFFLWANPISCQCY